PGGPGPARAQRREERRAGVPAQPGLDPGERLWGQRPGPVADAFPGQRPVDRDSGWQHARVHLAAAARDGGAAVEVLLAVTAVAAGGVLPRPDRGDHRVAAGAPRWRAGPAGQVGGPLAAPPRDDVEPVTGLGRRWPGGLGVHRVEVDDLVVVAEIVQAGHPRRPE